MMKKLFLTLCLISSLNVYGFSLQSGDKYYIEDANFTSSDQEDEFYFHVGDNMWLSTTAVNKDRTGVFTYEYDICRKVGNGPQSPGRGNFQQKWKCPYCFRFWDIGQKCQNPSCPSKY